MKSLVFKMVNLTMTFVAIVLGFSSCDGDTPCMYGSPYVSFKVSGKVTDKSGTPLPGARLILRREIYYAKSDGSFDYTNPYANDTTYASAEGEYAFEGKDAFMKRVRIVCDDTSGNYAPDSVTVELRFDDSGKKDDWNFGNANETVNFTLKKAGDE